MNLTPEVVQQLWTCMCERYGTTVVRKQDSWLMRLAARVLPTSDFLEGYVTTIGRTIYVPFEIGVEEPGWSLEAQTAVIAHECQHLVQQRRDGFWYGWRYATNTAARAAYETEAYRATLEMKYALGADGWDLYQEAKRHAEGLKNYGCTDNDVAIAAIQLAGACTDITRGAVKTEAARTALEYLNA